jgi:hypothetical protein
MRTVVICSLVIVSLTAWSYGKRRSPSVVVDRDEIAEELRVLRAELDAIDRTNAQSRDRATRNKVDRLVDRARAGVDAVDATIAAGRDRDRDDDRGDRRRDRAMDDGEFGQFLDELDAAAHSSDKLAIVTDAARYWRFTSDQVAAVVDHLSFGDDQVEAAATLHPRVVDPKNFHRVYKHLSHSSDREALRKRIGG